MKQYKTTFKCRCMNITNHHCSGVEVMSGTWKWHISLTQLIYPYGLHRVLYNLKDNDLNKIDEEWVKVKYRNSNRLPFL